MKPELQKQLYDKYPKIFRQKKMSMKETCMCWGIETPDSWYPILDCLCWRIQNYIDTGTKVYKKYPFGEQIGKFFKNPKLVGRWVKTKISQIEAVQVKEKFGSLRFYTTGYDKTIECLISMAEDLTSSICAECGSFNNVKATGGWITYLCDDCMQKLNKIPYEEDNNV